LPHNCSKPEITSKNVLKLFVMRCESIQWVEVYAS
jgi:hypothetical protein